MIKNFLIFLILLGMMFFQSAYAKIDKTSEQYLKENFHFSIMNSPAEFIIEKILQKQIKKDLNGDIDVKFSGYTLSSLKRGVFKTINVKGKNLLVEEVPIPYLELKTLTDYNKIDYRSKPLKFKSDIVLAYNLILNEESINTALQKKDYQKVLNDVNTIAYPLFEMKDLDIKIKNNRVYFIMRYNFPISPSNKNKTFVVSTLFNVIDNKIKTCDIKINEAYGIIQTNKTANLLNRLMPLSYTMSIINKRNCNTKIETVKIIDDLIKIDGKIYIKGD